MAVESIKARGATRAGPWGHGGTFATLTDVVAHYGQGKPAGLAAQAKERLARVAARSRHSGSAHGDHLHGRRVT